MTVTAERTAIVNAAQAQTMESMSEVADAKWPAPYAAMFMVSVSAALWFGIVSLGSALKGLAG